MNKFKALVLLLMTLLFVSCDSKQIHYDRDACERCKMIISDKNFAASVTNEQDGKIYYFDDIGCAILWFKEKNIKWGDSAKIQVVDFDTQKWIDAKSAFYSSPNITPMSYGFAAYSEKSKITKDKEVVNFAEVQARVLKVGK